MRSDTIIRYVLRIGAVFNGAAVVMLLFPASVGAFAGLPPAGSVFYSWLLSLFIGLFGATYAWMSFQSEIPRQLLGLAAIGKVSVFFVVLACWLRSEVPFPGLSVAMVDLAFGIVFFWWLRRSR